MSIATTSKSGRNVIDAARANIVDPKSVDVTGNINDAATARAALVNVIGMSQIVKIAESLGTVVDLNLSIAEMRERLNGAAEGPLGHTTNLTVPNSEDWASMSGRTYASVTTEVVQGTTKAADRRKFVNTYAKSLTA